MKLRECFAVINKVLFKKKKKKRIIQTTQKNKQSWEPGQEKMRGGNIIRKPGVRLAPGNAHHMASSCRGVKMGHKSSSQVLSNQSQRETRSTTRFSVPITWKQTRSSGGTHLSLLDSEPQGNFSTGISPLSQRASGLTARPVAIPPQTLMSPPGIPSLSPFVIRSSCNSKA